MDGGFIAGKLLTIQMLARISGSDIPGQKIGVGNSGLAATSNPVSQVLW